MINNIVMEIPAQQTISYSIKIGSNLLRYPNKWLPDNFKNKRAIIITDDNVHQHYGKILLDALCASNSLLFSFVPGESSKSYKTKQQLEAQMIKHHCDRDTIILALGGGVVGDIAGFIASTYMRGISYIQIPTTLLAMVDSSVGGKTGINTDQGKNLIGAFWQPSCVVVDMNCLLSLPQAHIINGLVEALKMFMTNNSDHFNYVVNNISHILNKKISVLNNIVESAIKIKVGIVRQDEKENNQRMILNFGHTIGHALEKISNYTLLHGYAVALGILVESKISHLLGFLSLEEYKMIKTLFLKLTISGDQLKKYNPNEIIQATKIDKKNKNNNVKYVLLKKIGEICNDHCSYAHPVSDNVVKQALIEAGEISYER